MGKHFRLIIFSTVVFAGSLACAATQNISGEEIVGDLINTPEPATAIPTTAPPILPTETLPIIDISPAQEFGDPGTMFFDDFADRESGWPVEYGDYWILDYYQEGYRISINTSEKIAWTHLGVEYDDVRMVVDARLIGGEEDNFLGVICRYQDVDNFYGAVITSDGYFAVMERLQGVALDIVSGDQFTHSVVINQHMELNLIEVACIGSQIKLTVNGQMLAEVTQNSLPTGDVGLIVGTFSANSTDVLFDNFTLYFEE